MMGKRGSVPVLHWVSLPTKLPIVLTAVVWLMLDRLQAPGIVKGVVWTLMAIVWLASIYGKYLERMVELKDLFKIPPAKAD